MRILACGVVRQNPEILRAHLETMKWQSGDFRVDYLWIDDNADEDSSALLEGNGQTWKATPKPDTARYAVDSATHRWNVPTFHWLAGEKQRLLDYAKAEKYDAVFMVDSDLLLSPDTLNSLWHADRDVVSAVFWTRWTPDAPPLPQCWLSHPYELQGRGVEAHEYVQSLVDRQLVRVGGLGACTLFRARVFDRIAYAPLLDGLPEHGMWQGEDRHFAVRAERNRVEMWADAWPDVWHCYRPEDIPSIPAVMDRLSSFEVGDAVSFTVEPLEETRLPMHTEHVRGVVGRLKLVPALEDALRDLRGEAFVRLSFPYWWPVSDYRGRTKLVRVRMLGRKLDRMPLTLDGVDYATQVLEAFHEPMAVA